VQNGGFALRLEILSKEVNVRSKVQKGMDFGLFKKIGSYLREGWERFSNHCSIQDGYQ